MQYFQIVFGTNILATKLTLMPKTKLEPGRMSSFLTRTSDGMMLFGSQPEIIAFSRLKPTNSHTWMLKPVDRVTELDNILVAVDRLSQRICPPVLTAHKKEFRASMSPKVIVRLL